jgi:hypothetical protein
MSLDKAIKYKKEYRKPYRGAAFWDSHCRNNNACSYCKNNRLHSEKKRKCSCEQQIKEWKNQIE